MANRWFTYISELAEQTQKEVTNSPQNWRHSSGTVSYTHLTLPTTPELAALSDYRFPVL